MSATRDKILSANEAYARGFGDRKDLEMPPARRFAVLTCMDARLDPARFAGLSEGDAHVIRNAGGRATDDAIRSLVISHKLLGTHEWFVIHHTDCGMETFNDQVMGDLLSESLKTAELGDEGWRNTDRSGGSPEGRFMRWHTFTDAEGSVRDDVERIRQHPLVSSDVQVYGFLFDVATGKLIPVVGADD